eukprot:scaffold295259_cov42-Prasinocladus_malaysianus.AAC.2
MQGGRKPATIQSRMGDRKKLLTTCSDDCIEQKQDRQRPPAPAAAGGGAETLHVAQSSICTTLCPRTAGRMVPSAA